MGLHRLLGLSLLKKRVIFSKQKDLLITQFILGCSMFLLGCFAAEKPSESYSLSTLIVVTILTVLVGMILHLMGIDNSKGLNEDGTTKDPSTPKNPTKEQYYSCFITFVISASLEVLLLCIGYYICLN